MLGSSGIGKRVLKCCLRHWLVRNRSIRNWSWGLGYGSRGWFCTFDSAKVNCLQLGTIFRARTATALVFFGVIFVPLTFWGLGAISTVALFAVVLGQVTRCVFTRRAWFSKKIKLFRNKKMR